jgi:hypothetical protein
MWVAAWAVCAVNCAHLIFDAAGSNEHTLYPWTGIDGIAWVLCPIGVLALAGSSVAVPRLALCYFASSTRPSR